MTQRIARMVAAVLGCLLFVSVANVPASACACCSNRGSRYVATEKLDQQRLAAIDQMTFGKSARLHVGESDGEETLVDGLGSSYTLDVERQKSRIVFTFRNNKGQPGTATLVMPRTISIFEVDPHDDSKDMGLGPNLYKEWTLTAPLAVTGILRRTGGPARDHESDPAWRRPRLHRCNAFHRLDAATSPAEGPDDLFRPARNPARLDRFRAELNRRARFACAA